MWLSLDLGYWLTLLIGIPAAGFLVRFFIIQHDCGHGSYFRSQRANDLVGRAIGVLTLTPYGYWRQAHAVHHASSGNLDRRGIGDITTLTVGEYLALRRSRRFLYRLYRHPFVLFGIGPSFLFLVKQRLPLELPLRRKAILVSVLGNNLAIGAAIATMAFLVGAAEFAMIQLPVMMLASSIGVWLFFVQHQFETAYWRRDEAWDFEAAALAGSSFYRLPRVLQWLTANIGIHHVHHLCSRIPNYRLQECVDRMPELTEGSTQITLIESLKYARFALWDADKGRMIRFRDLDRSTQKESAPAD